MAQLKIALNSNVFPSYWAHVYVDATAASGYLYHQAYCDFEIYSKNTRKYESPIGYGDTVDEAVNVLIDDLACHAASYGSEELPISTERFRWRSQLPLAISAELAGVCDSVWNHLWAKNIED